MRRIAALVASLLILISVLLTVIDGVCFFRGFYSYEYQKGAQAEKIGMSEEGLNEATEALLDYLQGKRSDIIIETEVNGEMREVFNERESLHMVDVRNLYQNAVLARNIMAGAAAAILCLLFIHSKERYFTLLKEGWRNAMLLTVLFVAFIAIWCAVDFNAFWMQFHYIFFDNDLFLLDPNTSIMINMFPESFFFDIVLLIILLYAAAVVIFSILISYFSRREMKQA